MVNVMVNAPVVDEVLLLVPVQPVYCEPLPAAFPRLVVQFVKSVFTADKILIVVPTVGAALEVIAVPW